MDFEKGTKELEEILKQLDSSEITLEEGIKLFEKGVLITKDCYEILSSARGKIVAIKEQLDALEEHEFKQ